MRVGKSFGEPCRYCGSNHIIVDPPSSSGKCAVCSHEANAWAERLIQHAEHATATARTIVAAAALEAQQLHRAEIAARRRAAVFRWARETRLAATSWARDGYVRGDRTSQA